MRAPLINIQDLNQTYETTTGPVHALSNIHLEIGDGEFIALVGPSGCGKTTLLKILAGLLEHTDGSVTLAGNDIGGAARGETGVVFQKSVLLPWRTILQNVLLPLELSGKITDEGRAYAKSLLRMVGLQDFEDKYPDELSGGMQQRASICRALVHHPSVLLMDEPFGALDAMTRDALNVEVNRIWRETGKTVVLITHSIQEAVFLAERIVIMGPRPGRIIDIIEVPFGQNRNLELLGTAEFAQLSSDIRSYFEVGAR
jgi:NitT/TauT family transport system ATP-binding protein